MALGDMLIERICGGYSVNGTMSVCKNQSLIGVDDKILVLVGTDDFQNFRVCCQVKGNLKAVEVSTVSLVIREYPGLYGLCFDFEGRKYVVFINSKKDKPSVTDITLGSRKILAEFLTIAK